MRLTELEADILQDILREEDERTCLYKFKIDHNLDSVPYLVIIRDIKEKVDKYLAEELK